jgi:hypothetical protein
MRCVRATTVAVEKQKSFHNLSVYICSLRYAACNAHAPYCHLWFAPLYNIFPHNKKKEKKKKKVPEYMMRVLIFSRTFIRNISHSKKKLPRYDKECILVSM